jgi:hypothetical protein
VRVDSLLTGDLSSYITRFQCPILTCACEILSFVCEYFVPELITTRLWSVIVRIASYMLGESMSKIRTAAYSVVPKLWCVQLPLESPGRVKPLYSERESHVIQGLFRQASLIKVLGKVR